MSFPRLPATMILLLLVALPSTRRGEAYSPLTHEQLIDLTWRDSIVPLLRSHYPGLTPAQLDEARAYAYGGCVIQDIGYYPFGDNFVSNLTHYVRTGDFVISLFRNASNADELAFAIGALSHFIGDNYGHSRATNLAVPVEFPQLRDRFGPVINYAQGRHQHVQTEFAFDIDEIAHHRFAPVRYLRHIGLKVPVRLVAVAYYQTYGLTEDFSKKNKPRTNVRGYRFAVHTFIPRIAYAITLLHRNHEPAESNTPERIQMDNEVAALAVENNWQAYRRKAGIGTYTLAGVIFILPKIGPLKLLAVKGPTEQTEVDYLHSVLLSAHALRQRLARFTPSAPGASATPESSSDPRHPLSNRDLDTGNVVRPGGYPLTDSTYASLLHRLTRTPTQPIPPGIKQDIESYYSDLSLPITTKKDPAAWTLVQADLAVLHGMPTSNEPTPYPVYGNDMTDSQ